MLAAEDIGDSREIINRHAHGGGKGQPDRNAGISQRFHCRAVIFFLISNHQIRSKLVNICHSQRAWPTDSRHTRIFARAEIRDPYHVLPQPKVKQAGGRRWNQ
jgi:hypothetical protein